MMAVLVVFSHQGELYYQYDQNEMEFTKTFGQLRGDSGGGSHCISAVPFFCLNDDISMRVESSCFF